MLPSYSVSYLPPKDFVSALYFNVNTYGFSSYVQETVTVFVAAS